MAAGAETWAARQTPALTHEHPVAYFCAEFGVHHSLPLYSGGLGMLAGDHLKSASDLGLPLVAVGLLYHHGYFRQRLRRDGWQEERTGRSTSATCRCDSSCATTASPVRIELEVRGRAVRVQAWRVEVGRVPLYLLDTNVEGNDEIDRLITGHLYGGDRETRCVQEMVFGIGGVRLLRRLGVEPHVFHLNEGHSAFLTLELARELTAAGVGFARGGRARCARAASFTTHTPVAAGHDEFVAPLVEKCFGERLLAVARSLARRVPEPRARQARVTRRAVRADAARPAACAARRTASAASTARSRASCGTKMWPERHVDEVPDHLRHQRRPRADVGRAAAARALREARRRRTGPSALHDAEAWARGVDEDPRRGVVEGAQLLLQAALVAFVRHRLFQARLQQGESRDRTPRPRARMFDPDALTIGFARRVAAYKRWELIL